MSLTSALSSAISGVQANQRQIQLVSNNVSNASVEGYSRKTAALETRLNGSGVDVAEVRREVDTFLVDQTRRQQSAVGYDATKAEFFSRIQDFFGTPNSDSAISNTLNNLQVAFEELAIEPENSAAQTEVVERAKDAARQFRTLTEQTQELRKQADAQIEVSVRDVNAALSEIRDLNAEIVTARGAGNPTGDLADARDRALKGLSEQMNVNTIKRESGEIVVMSADARVLVDSGFNEQLQFKPAGTLGSGEDAPDVTFANGDQVNSGGGGRLGALLEVRDRDLPNFQADLDRLAAKLRDQVNEVHNKATFANQGQTTLTGSLRSDGGTQLTELRGSFKLLEIDTAGKVQGQETIDLSSAAGNEISDVVDLVDTAVNTLFGGGANATRNADGELVINSGGTGSFIIRDIDSELSADLDADAGTGPTKNFSHFFGFNNLFETPDPAASEQAGPPAPANTFPGQPASDPTLGVGLGDATNGPGASAAGQLRIREDIVSDPSRVGRAVPRETSGEVALAAGDPTVAQDLAAVFDEAFEIGKASASDAGNLSAREITLSGFAGDILQQQASETERFERAATFQENVRDELEFRADSQSGVNIDEELARLTQYQQAFNANARVISTVNELFERLEAALR